MFVTGGQSSKFYFAYKMLLRDLLVSFSDLFGKKVTQ